jgi:hypothetical protein
MMFCMPSGLKRYQHQGCEHAINFSCFHRRQYLADQQACIAFEEVPGAPFMPSQLGHEWAAHTARTHLRAKITPMPRR